MKVFISRKLSEHSIFKEKLSSKGVEVVDESLLEFSPLNFEIPQNFDWIFFYSKNGVEFFFQKKVMLSSNVKLAAIGAATSDVIFKHSGLKADFIGDGIPETTAEAFKKIAAEKTVLFVRAEASKKSIQQILINELNVLELIVYKNVPKNDFPKSDANILLFTSSLNAEAYLKKYPLDSNQQLAAIGKPTAETLMAMGYTEVYITDSPDENALSNLILKISENNKP
jgi:uroporphyrinogen-III synthase